MRIMTDDGVGLHVTDDGTGTPILFVHEFAGDHRSWAGQVAGLREEYRCITYDARGYPPSDVPTDPASYSWRRAVADAVAVLDGLGIESAHVVGLSMGGFCALQLGVLHPDRARSLVVASAGSGAEPSTREAFLAETEAGAELLRTKGAAFAAGRMGVGQSRVQLQNKNPEAWALFVAQLAEHSAEGSALTLLGVQHARPSLYDMTDALARIQAPTLIVNGDEDEACLEPGLLLKRTIRSAGLMVLPHSGHVPNLEEPERFTAILRDFLRVVEADGWPVRDPRSVATSQFGLDSG